MNTFVRGLISDVHLAISHVSSPQFFSPTNSLSEMLGHVPTMEGNLGHESEGEGGTDLNGSLCERREWESVEALLLLIQVTG